MTREIKFRAWSKNGGYFVLPDSMHGKYDSSPFRFQDIEKILNDDGYVFQQFTGLEDKNGVEIYEGDIVKYEDEKRVVAYEKNSFELQEISTKAFAWDLWNPELAEVIGNIYQNPDLLK